MAPDFVRRLRRGPSVQVAAATAVGLAAASLYAFMAGREAIAGELRVAALLALIASVTYLLTWPVLTGQRQRMALALDLERGRAVQRSMFPAAMPEVSGLDIAACCLPMTEVGGDLYDFVRPSPTSLVVVVADVSGHGVPAALIASMTKVAFRAAIGHVDHPGSVLTNINRMLCGQFDGAFVTACCAIVDALSGHMTYAVAGHPPPFVRRGGGAIERLDVGSGPLILDCAEQVPATGLDLAPGDRIVFVTDGVLEAQNTAGEFFGDRRFGELLAGSSDRQSAAAFLDSVVRELSEWTGAGGQLQDDVTLLVVDVRA